MQQRNTERFGCERRSATGHAGGIAAATAAARRENARRSSRRIAHSAQGNRDRDPACDGGRLLMCAHVLVRVHVRRRRRGLHGARPVVSMTVMSPRQRRHGNSRDQNDRRHNAHKLYVRKPLLQAHAAHLSQEPAAAKQLWLIAAVTNPAASRRVCARRPAPARAAELCGIGERNSGVVHVIPNYDRMSSGRLLSKTAMLGATMREIQTVLVYRCPTTHRQVTSDIQTTAQALARLGTLKLALWCPHCASGHSVCANETVAQNAASSEAH